MLALSNFYFQIIDKGSDYDGLLQRHDEYFRSLDQIKETLV